MPPPRARRRHPLPLAPLGLSIALASTLGLAATAPAAPRAVAANSLSAPTQLTLPPPSGPDHIGTVSLHLIDRSRRDPWVSTRPPREIMIQLWYPARDVGAHPLAPWMQPGAAAHYRQNNAIPAGAVRLPTTHAHLDAPLDRCESRRPVVLYSPGFGEDRSGGATLVEDLASHGYIVVTIDHTHDAGEVEFPDGRVETSTIPPPDFGNPTDPVATKAVAVRQADTTFVLNQLTSIDQGQNPDAEHRPLPGGLRGALDLSKVAMFGHSLGGATAAAAMAGDLRVRAGINLDGALFGPVVTTGLDRPFLLMSSQDHNRDNDPTWSALWARLRGWRLDLRLTGSQHDSFTDLEVLLPQAAPALGLTPNQIAQILGPLDGRRALTIQRLYLRAFFDQYLRHRPSTILTGPSQRYPEIQFVR